MALINLGNKIIMSLVVNYHSTIVPQLEYSLILYCRIQSVSYR